MEMQFVWLSIESPILDQYYTVQTWYDSTVLFFIFLWETLNNNLNICIATARLLNKLIKK